MKQAGITRFHFSLALLLLPVLIFIVVVTYHTGTRPPAQEGGSHPFLGDHGSEASSGKQWVLEEAERISQNLRLHQGVADDAQERVDGAHLLPSSNLPSNQFQLVIKVLAFNRLSSFARCLQSLAAAEYQGDTVKLHIYIDHFAWESQEQHKSMVKGLSLLSHADQFEWVHGAKEVHFRTQNVGIQGQWLEAWWPCSDHEFAVMVEDDMELSPLFYRYLRSVVATYVYNPANFDPSIFGISLQRPRFVAGKGGGNLRQLHNSSRLFLYQMVGTWGQLLFPRPWKEFRIWYDVHKAEGMKPFLEGMITDRWYRKLGEKIWTPWFIKFVHARGYYNIYTNFLKDRALSVSHRDAGVNYNGNTGPDSRLIGANGTQDIDLWEMAPLKLLTRYDFCFRQVFPKTVVASSSQQLRHLLSSKQVVMVSLLGIPQRFVRNWLCHFQRLGLKNYVLMGDDDNMLRELGRRGHAVVHSKLGKEEEDMLSRALATVTDLDAAAFLRTDLLTLSSIRSVLRAGVGVVFTTADVLWMQNLLNKEEIWGDSDMVAETSKKQKCGSGLFYVRQAKRSRRVLDCAMKQLLAQMMTYRSEEQVREAAWAKTVCECATALQAPVKLMDDITNSSLFVPQRGTTSADGLSRKTLDLVMDLQVRGLWVIDDDLACNAITCLPA